MMLLKKMYMKKIENKIPDITNLATNTALNAEINEGKNKITDITNLVATTALTAVENKILDVSNIVKKLHYDVEIKDLKDKYFTRSGYNKLTNNILIQR